MAGVFVGLIGGLRLRVFIGLGFFSVWGLRFRVYNKFRSGLRGTC